MANLQSLIKQHNAKLLSYGKKPTRLCKCRYKDSCPLAAKCLAKCIACKAEVTATEKSKLYYGTSDGDLKLGLTTITASLGTKRHSADTELPKYIWKLSNEKIQHEIKWNIAAYASMYKCGSRRCDLCLTKKLKIMREDSELLLNKRSALVSKCRHNKKFILTNIATCIAIGMTYVLNQLNLELTYHVTLFRNYYGEKYFECITERKR